MTKKNGRPTKYKPEYCQIAMDYMKAGNTKIQLAAHLGVNPDSIHEWTKKHTEFSVAIKKAERLSQAFWEDILSRAALGLPFRYNGVDHKSYNTTLIIFLMKNRFKSDYGDLVLSSSSPFEYKPPASLDDGED